MRASTGELPDARPVKPAEWQGGWGRLGHGAAARAAGTRTVNALITKSSSFEHRRTAHEIQPSSLACVWVSADSSDSTAEAEAECQPAQLTG